MRLCQPPFNGFFVVVKKELTTQTNEPKNEQNKVFALLTLS